MDLPGSSIHGILQARILDWVAIPFARGSSQPRDWTQISYTAGGFFTELPEKPNTPCSNVYVGISMILQQDWEIPKGPAYVSFTSACTHQGQGLCMHEVSSECWQQGDLLFLADLEEQGPDLLCCFKQLQTRQNKCNNSFQTLDVRQQRMDSSEGQSKRG